jgi:hypothetical protein
MSKLGCCGIVTEDGAEITISFGGCDQTITLSMLTVNDLEQLKSLIDSMVEPYGCPVCNPRGLNLKCVDTESCQLLGGPCSESSYKDVSILPTMFFEDDNNV